MTSGEQRGIEQDSGIEQVTPVMKVAPSINAYGDSFAVVAGADFAKGHANGAELSAAVAESLQRGAIVGLEARELRPSLRFALLSSGDISSQPSIALGSSLR